MNRAIVALVCLAVPCAPALAVELTVDKLSGESVRVSWAGGSPTFRLYRSTTAHDVVDPSHQRAATMSRSWNDTPPAGTVWFYRVEADAECVVAEADTWVDAGNSNDNHGTSPDLVVDHVAGKRVYLRFRLTGVPSGARIDRADLTLYADPTPFSPYSTQLYAAAGQWSETNLTWRNQPGLGALVDTVSHSPKSFANWDATSVVQQWVDGDATNFGLIVEPVSAQVGYDAREVGPDDSPRLCIEWTPPVDRAADLLAGESESVPVVDSVDGVTISVATDVMGHANTDPVVRALDYLYRYRDLYGLTDPQAQLYLDHVSSDLDADRDTVRFGQRIDNIPVFGAYLTVHVVQGRIAGTDGRYLQKQFHVDAPTIRAGQARELAEVAVPAASGRMIPVQAIGEPIRQIYATELLDEPGLRSGKIFPVWRVSVRGVREADNISTFWTVLIDDRTGDTRLVLDEERTAGDRSGENFTILDAGFTTDANCWDDNTSPATTEWFTESGSTASYPDESSDPVPDGEMANDYCHVSYHHYHDFQLEGWDDDGNLIESMIRVGTNWVNASYVPGCDHIRFGEDYLSEDVYGHEYTHAVNSRWNQLIYNGESGALDESLGDVTGEFMDPDNDWEHGEDMIFGANRSLSDPPSQGGDPDHYANRCRTANDFCGFAGDNNGVHTNSGIPNKVGYLLSIGDSHNGLVVNGLGLGRSRWLHFWYQINSLGPSSSFANARTGMRNAAIWLRDHGGLVPDAPAFTNVHICDVLNAWASVGVGDPDTDCDGVADPPGGDGDGDGVGDSVDNCPNRDNLDQLDTDGDGFGDQCDNDRDNDGIDNGIDNCPTVVNPNQADQDADELGDACDDEADGDGVPDSIDNCPTDPNREQSDIDGDGQGDVCDPDPDGDGLVGGADNCEFVSNPGQQNSDGDSHGNACDNCPSNWNEDQKDTDSDGQGDSCDADIDDDGVLNEDDNCPERSNPRQIDNDGNGLGLWCDGAELALVDGLRQSAHLILAMDMIDASEPVVLPVFPCRGEDGTCPDWLPYDTVMLIEANVSSDFRVRVVDERGFVVATERTDATGVRSIAVPVDPDASYVSPAIGIVPHTMAGATERFEGKQYFVEFHARPGTNPGTVSGTLQVTTTLGQTRP